MMSTNRYIAGVLVSLMLASTALPALAEPEPAESFGEAFPVDGFYAALRWRAEAVNQDPFENDALAIPLRARVGYESDSFAGFSFKIEYDYVFDFGVDTYDEGGGNTPDRSNYPLIADPAGGDLNQAYLQWKSKAGDTIQLGRERIIYDNSRYIGNVVWRQNEQTFDAVNFKRLDLAGFDLRAAYLDKVHRIFGSSVPDGEHDLDSWLLNVAYEFDNIGTATGYWYDIENNDVPGSSTATIGLRWVGASFGESATFGYTLEIARQEDTGNNPVSFDATYLRGDFSARWGKPTWYIGYESLGGDDRRPGAAFRTPLATLHAFNGWADKFLTTPDAGLEDIFVGVKGPLGAWSWNVLWHDFNAESGGDGFGDELDASISRNFDNGLSLLFKGANFRTDSPAYGDTLKLWVQVGYSF